MAGAGGKSKVIVAIALDKLGQFAEATWALEEAIRRTEGEKQGC